QVRGEAEGRTMPELPATLARSPNGDLTVRAVQLEEPLVLDGALDEAVYARYQPATDFVQQFPSSGAPATEDTELWVFYDADHVYLTLRALDSRPSQMVANEMRRD